MQHPAHAHLAGLSIPGLAASSAPRVHAATHYVAADLATQEGRSLLAEVRTQRPNQRHADAHVLYMYTFLSSSVLLISGFTWLRTYVAADLATSKGRSPLDNFTDGCSLVLPQGSKSREPRWLCR